MERLKIRLSIVIHDTTTCQCIKTLWFFTIAYVLSFSLSTFSLHTLIIKRQIIVNIISLIRTYTFYCNKPFKPLFHNCVCFSYFLLIGWFVYYCFFSYNALFPNHTRNNALPLLYLVQYHIEVLPL